MQKTVRTTSRGRNWGTAGVLLASMLIAPLFGLLPAQADPPDHAPAWGYRAKQGEYRSSRKRHDWNDDDYDDRRVKKHRVRHRGHHRRHRRTHRLRVTRRRYRTFYRTRRDKNGRTYRHYSRVYR